jgi:hypothetical protein
MPRQLNEAEIVMAICFRTMSAWDFDYSRRREWVIWASRHHSCRVCGSPDFSPCVNLADKKLGKVPRINRQPHDERVDWARLFNGLKERGYYRPVIEQQIRRSQGGEEG